MMHGEGSMHMPRWSATTWTLVGLGAVVLLLAADYTRQAIHPIKEKPPAATPPSNAKIPPQVNHVPKVGEIAPDFTLPDTKGQRRRLSDFKGQEVVLTFFCG